MVRNPISAPRCFGSAATSSKVAALASNKRVKQDPLILPDQRHQRVRYAEDQVIIAHRQEFPLPLVQPLFPRIGLALRTMSVPAGNGDLSITCLMGSFF